jgi:hypothetical protein
MLAAVVEIKRWLRDDRSTSYNERLNRDRQIGLSLPEGAERERLLAWWSQVRDCAEGQPGVGIGQRVEKLRQLAVAVLLVVGIALGAGVAAIALGYEGDYPVNLFALLGVLVGIPGLLLVVTLILLPGRIPGLNGLRAALSPMNPGRWAGALLDRFTGIDLFAAFAGNQRASAFARWQLVVFSQWFGVGFFVGALAMAWLLVAFTDLAFGWSTTLTVQGTEISRAFSALAAPWSFWLPAAAPDVALVEASRFYRLEEGAMSTSRVVQLGGWWPFVLMTIASYGLLPRLVLLGVGAWRLRVATGKLLLDDADVTALLDRLNTPRVSYEGSLAPEAGGAADPLPGPGTMPVDGSSVVIIWNDAISDVGSRAWLRRRFAIEVGESLLLSVLQGDAERHGVLAAVPASVRRFVLFTKGWEPPILEFSDFLNGLREQFGPDVTFTLVPIDVDGESVAAAARDVWARALARQHDPHLYVVEADSVEAESS